MLKYHQLVITGYIKNSSWGILTVQGRRRVSHRCFWHRTDLEATDPQTRSTLKSIRSAIAQANLKICMRWGPNSVAFQLVTEAGFQTLYLGLHRELEQNKKYVSLQQLMAGLFHLISLVHQVGSKLMNYWLFKQLDCRGTTAISMQAGCCYQILRPQTSVTLVHLHIIRNRRTKVII